MRYFTSDEEADAVLAKDRASLWRALPVSLPQVTTWPVASFNSKVIPHTPACFRNSRQRRDVVAAV